ncbi:MAG: hypothetical protein RMN25_05935 [Anaerolineae bacterium]|nr:hypothetical protein [Thermoflexales bacterium]MDW8407306.1 hypothetical protein [Anaerolineae bacterium]
MNANKDHLGSTPATPIDVHEKTIQELKAESVSITNGGAGVVKGEQITVTIHNGGIGAVSAQKVEAKIQDGGIGAVAGWEVTANETRIAIALAGTINGTTKILIDVRAGLVAGLAIGVMLAALKMLVQARK